MEPARIELDTLLFALEEAAKALDAEVGDESLTASVALSGKAEGLRLAAKMAADLWENHGHVGHGG